MPPTGIQKPKPDPYSFREPCQRCQSLEADLVAANRMNAELRTELRMLHNENQILTRERDAGPVRCPEAGINTTNCQE